MQPNTHASHVESAKGATAACQPRGAAVQKREKPMLRIKVVEWPCMGAQVEPRAGDGVTGTK